MASGTQFGAVAIPAELRGLKSVVDLYVTAKIKQFAAAFARRLNLNLTLAQLEQITTETLTGITLQEQMVGTAKILRLVLRHDCLSTGCGENNCTLCQYNPSRLCKRNLKSKYLIDDHLRAKCGSPLRIELVDDMGACVTEGLPSGVQLEVHVLNGEKYKEICPDNTLLSHQQLKSCIISHHQKALLRRDGGSDDALRCFLTLERGQAPLSDLAVRTSSEALLTGKAPTFRLLVWAVDIVGEPVPNVTYVVSENFVVATKRVKHAIKIDIPSVGDHVSKIVHIGKATVDKLLDLRSAAAKEGFEIHVPDDLNCVDKVGTFQKLVERSEMDSDLKSKMRHLLKLSPEKWEEVAQHALTAVMPDFRPRVWWSPGISAGLLFACKNGTVTMENPIALVKSGDGQATDDTIVPIQNLDADLFSKVPGLKTQAIQAWYAPGHPGWAIYWKEGQQQDPAVMAALLQASGQQAMPPSALMSSLGLGLGPMPAPAPAPGPELGPPYAQRHKSPKRDLPFFTSPGSPWTLQAQQQAAGEAAQQAGGGTALLPAAPPLMQQHQQQQQQLLSALHLATQGATGQGQPSTSAALPPLPQPPQLVMQQGTGGQPPRPPATKRSPFALEGSSGDNVEEILDRIKDQFPALHTLVPVAAVPPGSAPQSEPSLDHLNTQVAALHQMQGGQARTSGGGGGGGSGGGGTVPGAGGSSGGSGGSGEDPMAISNNPSLNLLQMLRTDQLPGLGSLWGQLPSTLLGTGTRAPDGWPTLPPGQLTLDAQQLQQALLSQIGGSNTGFGASSGTNGQPNAAAGPAKDAGMGGE